MSPLDKDDTQRWGRTMENLIKLSIYRFLNWDETTKDIFQSNIEEPLPFILYLFDNIQTFHKYLPN